MGFEISFQEKKIHKGTPEWAEYLKYLTEEKLCSGKKGEALLKYPGYISDEPYMFLFVDSWPENLRNSDKKSIFIKKLNHFKIDYEEGKPLRAKAYLAVFQDWIKEE